MTRAEFIPYVHSFYATGGVYPMGATVAQVVKATKIHRRECKEQGKRVEYDSVDRERVRDILIERFGLKFPPPDLDTTLLA